MPETHQGERASGGSTEASNGRLARVDRHADES
jgi:hypothetical protein